MTADNRELGEKGDGDATSPVDFAFFARQTFDDLELQQDILTLFLGQARRIVPTLGSLPAKDQGEAAHLLAGSARGIGAWAAADAASTYEAARVEDRAALLPRLIAAFTAVGDAIEARLAS